MNRVIDRRLDGRNKSAVNRRRFIKRFKGQLKKAAQEAMAERSITDMDSGEQVNIPTRDIGEPVFGHGRGGRREIVNPGNKEFITGDRVQRPEGGGAGGRGSQGSPDGSGEDDFAFELSRDEFLELFFEDLELPNMVKRQIATTPEFKSVRAGFTTDGVPANIDVVRSLKGALTRRTAMAAPYTRGLHEAQERLDNLLAKGLDSTSPAVQELLDEIEEWKSRIAKVPWIDTFDLRYANRVLEAQPTTRAVMFCIMDVSGSMDQSRKDLAKRFFTLLYLFLKRNYKRIEVVFIRHHTIASEVEEEEFFYSRETGGTVVSSALKLTYDIIRERYPTDSWNIYAAQASDGDNWQHDSPGCREALLQQLMPCMQYYAYIEITPHQHQSLWAEYTQVETSCENFAMRRIDDAKDIWPVFRDLFGKQSA